MVKEEIFIEVNGNKRPNILIIYTDEHRYDCIGAYGNKDILTPNIDKLAADGVLYHNSFCSYPVCTPSRYSFISGLYVHQHLGWSNHCTLPSGVETFPRILKETGYRTKAVGKMHYTPTYLDVGFEEMELAEQDGPGRHDDDYHRYLRRNGLVDKIDLMDQVIEFRQQAPKKYWDSFGSLESDLDKEDYSTTWIGDRAIDTIKGWGDGENLLMVGFIKPHHPFDPPAPWSKMYDPDKLSILPGWTENCLIYDLEKSKGYFPNQELTENKLRKVMANYYGTISQIDYYVGKMIDLLEDKGIYDNTMIIFTSDHGDYMGYHHMILKGNYMYDPLIKVPLIIKYPGNWNRGTESQALVSNVDIATTILKQAGCQPGKFMQGLDLTDSTLKRDIVFAESGWGDEYMARSYRYKLLLCKDLDKSLFFDLQKDPLELNNLFHHPDYQEKIEEYTRAIARFVLFDAPSPIHLDENAPIISGKNIPSSYDGHREESINYFRINFTIDLEGEF